MFRQTRRAYQVFFLALFLFLVVAHPASLIRGYHVEWFLGLDPLVALTTALATRSLHHAPGWATAAHRAHPGLRPLLLRLDLPDGRAAPRCSAGSARKRKVPERVKAERPAPRRRR